MAQRPPGPGDHQQGPGTHTAETRTVETRTVVAVLVELRTVLHTAEEEEEQGDPRTALHSYSHRHNPPVQQNLK